MPWQPIDTIPKERRRFLVWVQERDGFWTTAIWMPAKTDEDWVLMLDEMRCMAETVNVTHWMDPGRPHRERHIPWTQDGFTSG